MQFDLILSRFALDLKKSIKWEFLSKISPVGFFAEKTRYWNLYNQYVHSQWTHEKHHYTANNFNSILILIDVIIFVNNNVVVGNAYEFSILNVHFCVVHFTNFICLEFR